MSAVREHRARASRALLALIALLAAAALAACGGADSGGGSGGGGGGEPKQEFQLGLSTPFLSTPFFVVMNDFVEQEARAQKVSMLEPTNANQDAGKQVTDVRNLISAGATGILAGVVDASAIVPALEYARSRDIPFVVVDDAPAGGELTMTVRADNSEMGRQACQEMGRLLEGEGSVLSLQGDLATTNGRDRTTGFSDCLKEEFPDMELIERPTKWQTPEAAEAAQTVLAANRDLAGIYMQSDSVMLSAVLAALKRAGRDAKVGEEGHVALVSIDGTALGLEKIRSGELDALVSQPLDLYAKYGVQYLREASEGTVAKVGPTDHDSEIVEDANGNLMDLLPAPLVTKENVDDETLWGNASGAKE